MYTAPEPVRHAGFPARLCAGPLTALGLLAVCGELLAAPGAGDRYQVGGRCVTLTRVVAGQAYYAWNEGSRSGSGNLPASALGARCDAQAATNGTAPAVGMEDGDDGDDAEPQGTSTAPLSAPPVASPPGVGPVAGDAAFRDEILQAHNQVRCMHGVPPLSWHPEVAAYAQDWVGRGGFNHSNSYNAAMGPLAENLYGSSGQPRGADAVGSWYGESRGYDYSREGSSGTGHFTALIWKDAKYVGCARANGHLFCNYWSGTMAKDCSVPNMQGCYRQEVMPRVKDEATCR